MRKSRYLLIVMLLITEILFAEIILEYPIKSEGDTISYMGQTDFANYSFGYGEYQNLAISPNYFNSYSMFLVAPSFKEYDLGLFIWEFSERISFLEASVENPLDTIYSNIAIRMNQLFAFEFYMPEVSQALTITAGPYIKFDAVLGYYNQIENVLFQSYFNMNLGGSIRAQYDIANIIRAGLKFNSALVGIDFGRDGYNKDFISDIGLATFGNYLDMSLTVYGEIDLSRVEVLGLSYSHEAFSAYDDNNTITSGENRFGILYGRKFFR